MIGVYNYSVILTYLGVVFPSLVLHRLCQEILTLQSCVLRWPVPAIPLTEKLHEA